MKIGETIKEIREEKKLSREDVAEALGITPKAYSNIENNIADITLTRLYELSDIFECAPEYILSYQEKSTYTNHFNNYDGNKGTINIYQGAASDQVSNLEKQITESKDKVDSLKHNVRSKN